MSRAPRARSRWPPSLVSTPKSKSTTVWLASSTLLEQGLSKTYAICVIELYELPLGLAQSDVGEGGDGRHVCDVHIGLRLLPVDFQVRDARVNVVFHSDGHDRSVLVG
eukprot:1181082-Prorocentrum_minimum.AAC.4